MSRLDELIQELCPDGVEYKTLGEICELSAGGDVPKDHFSKELTEHYSIPIYSNGTEKNALYGYTDTAKIIKPCVTVAARGTIGYCSLRKAPFYPVVRLICAIPQKNVLVGFLKYYIDTIKFQVPTTGIPQLTVPMVSKYKGPVPPLPVQREIVRILDNFTELTAELTVRKKQYEYYAQSVIGKTYGAKMMPIKELGKWSGGGTPSISQKDFWSNGTISWVTSKDMKAATLEDSQNHITKVATMKSSAKLLPKNTVAVVVRSGILKHTLPVAYIPFETTINQDWAVDPDYEGDKAGDYTFTPTLTIPEGINTATLVRMRSPVHSLLIISVALS